MSQLAFYLFGPPRLEIDGEPLHISRRKAMALLAYLAVTAQPHSRESLAALLWPEHDPSSARRELRRMLSFLNKSLGAGWVQADREMAALNSSSNPAQLENFWLDTAEFQAKLGVWQVHKHPPTEVCPKCLTALEEALDLYKADFMAGFSSKDSREFEEWQFFQAEGLRRQLTNALVQLSSYYAGILEYETAIKHTRRWLGMEPLHEPAHRQLMVLYEKSGQRAAALRQYEACQQALQGELGVDPSDETRTLFERIRSTTLISLPDNQPLNNLPAQPTRFIGRQNELTSIRKRLKNQDCHLLTLLGPGGSGKTRLAIEAAAGLIEDFKHGVFFINLAPLQDVQMIPTTLASALKISFTETGLTANELLDYLRNKEMLLVLDNFEHLLEGVDFVNWILLNTQRVKILATSRVRLMVTGEHLFPLMGMTYPDSADIDPDVCRGYSALRLFEAEAKRVDRDFRLNQANLPGVIHICTLLEGMPLGIVLAANWIRVLTLDEIEDEINKDLTFLEVELRDLPRRQRSLQSVFNHSWRLLSEAERQVMEALSVFRGGFTRQAAYQVAGASLGDLMGLIDKSILHRTETGRYEIHELLRHYAAEQLRQDLENERQVQDRHSDYYCQALAEWERGLQGPKQTETRKEMIVEIDNIRAAWDWAVDHTRIEPMMAGLAGFCIFMDLDRRRINGAKRCHSLAEKLADLMASEEFSSRSQVSQNQTLILQARTLFWEAWFNILLGNVESYDRLCQECLSILERSELADQDTRLEEACIRLILSWSNQKSLAERLQLAEQARNLFFSLDEPWWQGNALRTLAHILELSSRTKSIETYQESLAVRRKLGNVNGITDSLERLSWFAASQFQFKQAEKMLQEALSISIEMEDHLDLVAISGSLVIQLVWQGRFFDARDLVREIMTVYSNLEYQQSFAALFHARASYPDQYLGEYEVACRRAQQAQKFLGGMIHYSKALHIATAKTILGNVALGEGSYREAQERFQESLSAHMDPDIKVRLHALQGFAARGLNQTRQAQAFFYKALMGAVRLEHFFSLTHIFPGIALIFLDQGDTERAVELYALASTQAIVANSKWFADIVGDEIAAAAEALPDELAENARERGQSMEFWETAVALLEELGEMGWNTASLGEVVG